MKKIILILLLAVMQFSGASVSLNTHCFDKVVLWGYKLHSHTHSYIHFGFKRAFDQLGYQTYWLDDTDDVSDIDFSNSLFITVGGQENKIPLRHDCRYVLHNCDMAKYQSLLDAGNCLILQVYVHAVLERNVEKIQDYIFFEPNMKCLYQPWATDLLPHEINEIKFQLTRNPIQRDSAVYMAASVMRGDMFENWTNYEPFKKACIENGVSWRNFGKISLEENIDCTQRSLIAPAIQSKWQCEKGYIPCRIFKNISYGQCGATNSKTVYELFHKKIVFNPNTYDLFYDTLARAQTITQEQLFEQMDFVRDHHTYINRIATIFDCLHRIKPLYKTLSLQPMKNPQGALDRAFLQELQHLFAVEVFVETGTYMGATAHVAATCFDHVHTIELSEFHYRAACRRFAGNPRITLYKGDSADVLVTLLPQIKGRILFWLDGHYSAGNTARGSRNTPIMQELEAIKKSGIQNAVILVDDIRCFVDGAHDDSITGYPTLHELKEMIVSINPGYECIVYGDSVLAYLKTDRVVASPVLKACTISRLQENDTDMMKAELVIAQAAGQEKAVLQQLPIKLSVVDELKQGGHYRLWYGLMLMHEKQYAHAYVQFLKAIELGCDAQHVDRYIQQLKGT